MRVLSASLLALALTACGQSEKAAPAASDAPAEAAATPAAAPAVVPSMSKSAACLQAVNIQYGQGGDAVTFNEAASTVSWRAPVDGGQLTFTCQVEGASVILARDNQTVTVPLSEPAAASAQEEAR